MNGQPHAGRPRVLRATYRLQFNHQFTLARAIDLVAWLRDLGVSHVYASPLLKACPGSTHGYDVCDYSQINPEIGTEAELAAFVVALRRHDMGLVLDCVPNHMGIGPPNPWWWDLLKNGRESRYADYFDVDWDPPDAALKGRVLVPVLGDEFDRVLGRGELKLVQEGDELVLSYFEHRFPITPRSVALLPQPEPGAVSKFNSDLPALDALMQQQHYRLAHWRRGDTDLNYRRFFNITTLAGIRVEDPRVFAAAHARLLDWGARERLDGLRIDHPDGLRDPRQYLERLRAAFPRTWIVVEKILEPGEELPSDWPVAGTTGYDFLSRVGGLFLDPAAEGPLTDFYAAFTGEPTDYDAVVRGKKRLVLESLLVAEVSQLTRRLESIAARQGRAFIGDSLRRALVELVACFPVYRSYTHAEETGPEATPRVSPADLRHVEEAVAAARRETCGLEPAPLDFIGDLLRLRWPGEDEVEFVLRFQQLTGPAMAKGVEDTAFYCFNRFVALNEVGGDPGRFGLSLEQFHAACEATQRHWPQTLLATSTHDTKRSEDVRARLALLSEIPDAWTATVQRWSAMNEKHRRDRLPDRNAEYLFYQTLVGAWPLPAERALAYMDKAAREAKQHTSWTQPNAAYEEALKHFVAATLRDRRFTDDLAGFVASLIEPGRVNSLAQTLIKLTAPGVPDIYQGTELWDLSLVDPDNRRPVDFAARRRLLAELAGLTVSQVRARGGEGLPKLWLIQKALEVRHQEAEAFGADGSYAPLSARGAKAGHLVAFVRGGRAVTVTPRLVLRLARAWGDTTLCLPAGEWRNALTGERISGGERRAQELFGQFPVALLARDRSSA